MIYRELQKPLEQFCKQQFRD